MNLRRFLLPVRPPVLATAVGLSLAAATLVAPPASAAQPVGLRPGSSHTVPVDTAHRDLRAAASFSLDRLPSGGPLYAGVPLRVQDADRRYHAVVRLDHDGSMRLDLRLVEGRSERTLSQVELPGTFRAGQTLRVEGHVAGTAPVALAARAWSEGEPRPGWQVGHRQAQGTPITTAGGTGATAYLSSDARPLEVAVSDVDVVATGSQPAVGGSSSRPAPAPVPAPAPSPAPAPRTGSAKPDASNTGVPAGTSLRVHHGDLRITTPGTVVDGVDVRGFLRVEARDVTVRRSVVRGGTPVRVEGVVTVAPTARNFVIEDSEVYPSQRSVMLDGIKGANFTARRVHVHGGVDNIKVHGDDVLIEGSYLHDQDHFSKDPLQGGRATHNDALQVLGGRNIRVVGNTIVGDRDLNAAVQVTQDFAATRLELRRNWIDGGGCSVNLNHKKLKDLRGVTIADNRFGRDTEYGSCGVIMTRGSHPAMSGNTYTDGATVKPKYM